MTHLARRSTRPVGRSASRSYDAGWVNVQGSDRAAKGTARASAAVPLRSRVPGTAGNRRERSTKNPSVFAAFASIRGELQGSEPATFHRGVRFKLAFLSRFRALCGLFAVPIPRVCHRVRVYVDLNCSSRAPPRLSHAVSGILRSACGPKSRSRPALVETFCLRSRHEAVSAVAGRLPATAFPNLLRTAGITSRTSPIGL
jgi:hypothetical protein